MALKQFFLFTAVVAVCNASPQPLAKENNDVSELYRQVAPESRIVGGSAAPEGSVPYMVALSSGLLIRSFVCGGSIISKRTVLTAAHCIDAVYSRGSLAASLRGTVGTNFWNLGGASYRFSSNSSHPNYVEQTIKNDIGLLFTDTDIVFTSRIAPVSLSFDFVPTDVRVRAAGWGRIRVNGALSSQLLELFKNTIDGDRCVVEVAQSAAALHIRAPAVEPHIELCTYHSPSHGMCNGDSGSALVQASNGRQVGIVSWGIPCARGAPDMYVRVSAFRDFIIQNAV